MVLTVKAHTPITSLFSVSLITQSSTETHDNSSRITVIFVHKYAFISRTKYTFKHGRRSAGGKDGGKWNRQSAGGRGGDAKTDRRMGRVLGDGDDDRRVGRIVGMRKPTGGWKVGWG